MPDEVSRQLFEALRLEMFYDHQHQQVRNRITLTGDTIDTVSRTAQHAVLPFRPPAAAQTAATVPESHSDPHGSAWCPQRDSNPCRRLERAVS
jgi:site-specific DNA recombinase